MPRRDGTGPLGAGPVTGRGMGYCAGWAGYESGFRPRFGCGFGRGFGLGYSGVFAANSAPTDPGFQKELLEQQKTILQERVKLIEKQLKRL